MGIRLAREVWQKTPTEVLQRDIGWPVSDFADGETVTSFVFDSVLPATPLVLTAAGQSGRFGQLKVENGTDTIDYVVKVHGITSKSQRLEGEITIKVRV